MYRTVSMRQKTINLRNQGSFDKKRDFLVQSLHCKKCNRKQNSASLLTKNTISTRGIILATHSVLLYIIDSKIIFPTMPMGENPWYRRENSTPRLCWEMPTMYRKILMPG